MKRTVFVSLLIILLFGILTLKEGYGKNSILYSKHDLSHLNERSRASTGVAAMTGLTFNDYGEVCIYCHVPHGEANGNGSKKGEPKWNRNLPVGSYMLYNSPTIDSNPFQPSEVSLVCLSCHDGTVAIDSIRVLPRSGWKDSGVHYKMRKNDDGGNNCGKCHARPNGARGPGDAHNASAAYLTRDMRDDHPISLDFMAAYNAQNPPEFNPMEKITRLTPVKFFNGKVECATCHDPHNPDEDNSEGRDPFLRTSNRESALCFTCHIK